MLVVVVATCRDGYCQIVTSIMTAILPIAAAQMLELAVTERAVIDPLQPFANYKQETRFAQIGPNYLRRFAEKSWRDALVEDKIGDSILEQDSRFS